MKIEIVYDKKAARFLKRNPQRLTVEKSDALIRSAMKKLHGQPDTNVDVKALKGRSKGTYRIRSGDIRIIFYFESGEVYVVTVEDIGFRGDAYTMREDETKYQAGSSTGRSGTVHD